MKARSNIILSIVTLLVLGLTSPLSTASAASSLAVVGTTTTSTSTSFTTSTSTSTAPVLSTSSYSPQPGDINLKVGPVFLDLAHSYLQVGKGFPEPVDLILKGSLPDPCHQLRVVVSSTSTSSNINVKVYSVFNPQSVCISVLQPFIVAIPLGFFTGGLHAVYINGLLFGKFVG